MSSAANRQIYHMLVSYCGNLM